MIDLKQNFRSLFSGTSEVNPFILSEFDSKAYSKERRRKLKNPEFKKLSDSVNLPKRLSKKTATSAVDFSILDVFRTQQTKKIPNPENLQFLDFNGVPFQPLLGFDSADFKSIIDFSSVNFDMMRSVDPKTGQLFYFKIKGKGKNKKFIHKKTNDDLLSDRFSMQKVMAKLLPKYRVSKCLNTVREKGKGISVYKTAHDTISLSNLQTCASVWHCPVCAAKISERRRAEVNQAIERHKATGGSVSFITRTVPHTKGDSLLDLRDKFRQADVFYKNHRDYRTIVKANGVIGSIKVYELTVGEINGWHLHVHEVLFHQAGAFRGVAVSENPDYSNFLNCLRSGLYKRWVASAVKAGFDEPSFANGLQIQNGDFAAEYFAKWGRESESIWGIDAELTKAHIKKAKKGFSPFDLIRLYRDTKNEQLVPIIKEYAESMHGQRQLIWSRGLKGLYGVDDVSDDTLVEEKTDDAVEIGVVCPLQWKFIVKNDLRVEFMLFAAQGWDVVTDFLTSFPDYPAYSLYRSSD